MALAFAESDASVRGKGWQKICQDPAKDAFATRRPARAAAAPEPEPEPGARAAGGRAAASSLVPAPDCFFFHTCCIECGNPFSHLATFFFDMIKSGANAGDAMDSLGVDSRCCRSHFMTQHTHLFHPPSAAPIYDVGSVVHTARVRDPPTTISAT